MDKIFKHKIFKYITPLGILSLIFFIWTIISIIIISNDENDPGFGGLILVALGIVFIVSFLLDRILSLLLKRNLNIKVQAIIVFAFLICFSILILL